MDELSKGFDEFHEALRAGDRAGASRAFHALVGLRPGVVPAGFSEAPPPAASMQRYDALRKVDLVALSRGARSVAKFEDLTRAQVKHLERLARTLGWQSARQGPYARRFDRVASEPGVPGDRYAVVVSRGPGAREVLEAETDRGPEGTRRAGLLLGYPVCCVERFVEVSQGPEALREGVNEAGLRAFVGEGEHLPWRLNPLCTVSLVGFLPCSPGCALALGFAQRVLDALAAEDRDGVRRVRATLLRPVLFFRYALWFAFEGAVQGADVVYRAVLRNDDGEADPGWVSWSEGLLGCALSVGEAVSLRDGALTVSSPLGVVATWRLTAPTVPRLLRFDDVG